jgi:pimeloyl-ACP methyl ester carboxylesterase
VQLPGRVRLEYVQQGDPDGVPVIMLHGVTDSWRSFEHVLPHLPQSINAVVVSLRGHGDSERPEAGYEMREMAADVIAVMDALGLERAFFVGHSMGTVIAQRIAFDYPARALGLILLGAFIDFADNQVISEFARDVAVLNDPVSEVLAREFQESTVARPVRAGLLDMATAETLKLPARVWRAVFAGMLAERLSADLGNATTPALLIFGSLDAFCTRSDQDTILASYPAAELYVYEGHGHAMHWEDPERVATDLAAFVRRVLTERRLAGRLAA